MLDLLNKPEIETKADTAAKRERVEAELRTNSARSDREIGRICGVDGKTVAAARDRLGMAGDAETQTPTERRHMLIEGVKDFDRHNPPGPSDGTAEEAVDNAIAKSVVKLAPEHEKLVTAAVDQCNGQIARERAERQAKAAAEDQANEEQMMVPRQSEITIQFRDDTGHWVIKQKNWPDDDAEIWINEEHMQAFLDALCDRLGIGSIRGA